MKLLANSYAEWGRLLRMVKHELLFGEEVVRDRGLLARARANKRAD